MLYLFYFQIEFAKFSYQSMELENHLKQKKINTYIFESYIETNNMTNLNENCIAKNLCFKKIK
jgi:hypothetical protein